MLFLQADSQQADEAEPRNEEGLHATNVVNGVELDDVESAIFDAWRYLRMDSAAFLSKTPREFPILMAAENERRYDEYELMASKAMMMRAAYHKEKLKHRDLYKRPSDKSMDRKGEDDKAHQ